MREPMSFNLTSLATLLFRVVIGFGLAGAGFYMAIEEQHKTNADWRIEMLGVGMALLGLFTAPYAGPALQTGGDQASRFGRRLYDRYNAAKRGDPITDELSLPPAATPPVNTVNVVVNEGEKK